MNKVFFFIIVLFFLNSALAQPYQFIAPLNNTDLNCHVDATHIQNKGEDIRRAVFRIRFLSGATCTGTLVNRSTGQDQLEQYFVSSWHCFRSGSTCGGTTFNFGNNENEGDSVDLIFNFQSPPNQSNVIFTDNNNPFVNRNGRYYTLRTRIERIEHVNCGEGDFILCRIRRPIPTYYNVYYAGWSPITYDISAPQSVISHPSGSLKKIAEPQKVIIPNPGGATVTLACHSITKLIDGIFSRLFGRRKWSVQSICSYTNIPLIDTRYVVERYNYGRTEQGSSGAALLNGNNRIIGTLSGGLRAFQCDNTGSDNFGRFFDYYYRQGIKSKLNPSNSYATDQAGVLGRQITCHNQIDMRSPAGERYDLYPANLYQSTNALSFSARNDIYLGGNNTIVHGQADFTFTAGGSIDITGNFDALNGSNVNLNSGSTCNYQREASEELAEQQRMEEFVMILDQYEIPDQLTFDENKYIDKVITVSAFPNPTNDVLNLLIQSEQLQNAFVSLRDVTGKELLTLSIDKSQMNIVNTIDLKKFPNGMYQVEVVTEKGERVITRVVVMK